VSGGRPARRVALICAAGAARGGAAPALAGSPPGRTVRIGDNYFTPTALKVRRGTTVTWKWPGADVAGDVHDVKLRSGPKGVRRFHSEAASTAYRFKRKLTVPGTYRIVCTLHESMRMRIVVRR
jgi:plastocyanin